MYKTKEKLNKPKVKFDLTKFEKVSRIEASFDLPFWDQIPQHDCHVSYKLSTLFLNNLYHATFWYHNATNKLITQT